MIKSQYLFYIINIRGENTMSTQEIILLMVNELCKNYFENAEYIDMDETMTICS